MGMTRGESALNGDWSLLRVAGVINERVGAGSEGVYMERGRAMVPKEKCSKERASGPSD